MNTNKINKIADAASLLASRAANLAVMTALTDAWSALTDAWSALTDAWSALTDEQRADFTTNVSDYGTVAVATSMGAARARLATDEWHEDIGEDNAAAAEYPNNLETLLDDIDGDTQHMGELWDGADPEEGTSHHPLYYTKDDLDTARNMHQTALDHMAETIAATN